MNNTPPNDNNDKNNKNTFASMLSFKNLFFFIILLSFAPAFFKTIKKYVKRATSPDTYVGCLNITGVMTDSSFYVKHIHKFLHDKKIKALLLKIKTPGGLPGTSQTLFNEIKQSGYIFKKIRFHKINICNVIVLLVFLCECYRFRINIATNDK